MSFFSELKRRNVIRVGVAYVVVAWLILQFSDVVLNNIEAPGWVFQVIMLVLGIGLPLVLVFAWAFEMTPDGLKKEKDVDRSQSITSQTGKKLNNTILILLALAVIYLLYDKFSGQAQPGSEQFSQPGSEQTAELNEKNTLTPSEAAIQADNNPALAETRQSIAVLPFHNRSRDEDDAFFADGIHDDLLTQLAKIKDLKVISRTSVMKYRDTQMTIPEIAAELNVSSILEGGIQRAGDRIRINAQLIEVSDDEHLWAETYDREMTVENIFDIQSEITRHIVTAIRGELSEEESGALKQRPTNNLEAYEAYLKAKAHLNDPLYRQEKYINAEEWLKKAVEYDPGFALAWGLLVVTHGQAIWQGYDESPERFEAALNALHNVEKFGPNLPETLAARAEYLYRVKVDFHAAEPLLARASQAKPGDADLLTRLAITERRTGQFEQSITHLQMAIELDPANLDMRVILLDTLVLMGAYDRAEPLVDLWMEKFPDTQIFKVFKARAMALGKGQVKQARAWMTEVEPTTSVQYWQTANQIFLIDRDFQGLIDMWSRPPLSELLKRPALKTFLLTLQGRAHHYLGNKDSADEYQRAAIESGNSYRSKNIGSMSYNLNALALAYAHFQQFDQALEAINRSSELLPESADSLVGPQVSVFRARILGMAGQREAALTEIKRLLTTPAGLDRWDLYLNPDWDFFRDDERFNALARPNKLEAADQ